MMNVMQSKIVEFIFRLTVFNNALNPGSPLLQLSQPIMRPLHSVCWIENSQLRDQQLSPLGCKSYNDQMNVQMSGLIGKGIGKKGAKNVMLVCCRGSLS